MASKKKAAESPATPAAKTKTTRARAAKTGPAASKAAPRRRAASRTSTPADPSEESIRLAAYYLAEKDGFQRPPQEYWTEAVASVQGGASRP